MDAWSWPEVYAACLRLYQFDVERLERARQIFYSATPSLEHCVEFSLSDTTVQELLRQVTELAVSFVTSPNGLYLAPVLLHQTDSPRRDQDGKSQSQRDPFEDTTASIGAESVRATWLYGVPERDHDDSGCTSFASLYHFRTS
ncbi:hypothetical protein EXIGLDRAFT_86580 [Exidia glandulosa HHB12029]|uniref:Uncharacterized protein n=1 Tax=Exidia glandulosa HHB12029 TaxID=1314781 RepID=A0A165HF30_EXIGL|nr:hypothetical protein EXIGLDRAFT_86580 [Exidia glandulosa HHB12029]